MPRSSGTYTLPAGNPVVTGTTITSTWANTTLSDIATALTGSVATDGTSGMTGILQMGNNKITGVADGTASSDVATVNQIANPTITGGTIDGAPIGAANPKNGAFLALSAATAAFSGTSTAPTVTPSSDNSTKIATTAFVQSAINAVSSGVTSFNTRSGAVTLISADVTTALGYTPYNAGGATVVTSSNFNTYAPTLSGTGAVGTWGISISGNAATASTVTNGVYTTGNQTIAGDKTFTGNSVFENTGLVTIKSNALTYGLYTGGTTTSNSMFFSSSSINFWDTDTGNQYNSLFYIANGTALIDQAYTFAFKTPGSASATSAYQFFGDGTANKTGGGSWGSISDSRLKENVNPLTGALAKIASLNPVSYTWKIAKPNDPTVGFIAQEVQSIIPNAVTSHKPTAEEEQFITDKTLTIGWQNDMTAYLVGAIKELKAIVDAQAIEIAALKG
jgi:hypothetical protein